MENITGKTDYGYIDRNISEVRAEIKSAAEASGRRSGDITFLAAVKTADTDEINYIHNVLGINDIGENRVQQLMSRYGQLDKDNLRIHFIGKLQRNKVKYILDKVYMIHSVDTQGLADEISSRALKCGRKMKVLVEVNIGREPDKSGAMPENVGELAEYIAGLDGLELCGFMTMAPVCENDGEYRIYFSRMRELAYDIWHNTLGRDGRPMLSMGMSGSFRAAVSEGADIVRIGRRLFAKGS